MIKKTGFIEIKIGTRKVAFKFGMGAFAKFCEIQNVSLAQIGDVLDESSPYQVSALINLLYSAALYGERKQNRPTDFEPEDVADWLDDITPKDLVKILETMGQARIMGKGIDQVEQKKTVPKK